MWCSRLAFVLYSILSLERGFGAHQESEQPNCSRPDPSSSRKLELVAGHAYLPGYKGDGSVATLSRFRLPTFLALDQIARLVYVADTDNHAVRVVNLTSGFIEAFAGHSGTNGTAGDGGPASMALLCRPHGLTVDLQAGQVYIADFCNHAVRVVSLETQRISVLAGVLGEPGNASFEGFASEPSLNFPVGLALDSDLRRLYITNYGDGSVKVIDLVSGLMFMVTLGLNQPMGIALDPPRSLAYVACYGSHTIARIAFSEQIMVNHLNLSNTTADFAGSGNVPTEPGDGDFGGGPASEARLYHPTDVALFQAGQVLYIADGANPSITKLEIEQMRVSVAIPRSGRFWYRPDDIIPVGLALEESEIEGFKILNNERSYDDKEYTGQWFYFDDRAVPSFQEGIHTVYHYRNGNLLDIKHLKFYKHSIYMKGWPTSCPTCNAQGLSAEHDHLITNEFLVGDVLHIDYLFPPTRQRLYMAEGHNHIVRYADVSKGLDWICELGWEKWRRPMPIPLEDGDDGIQAGGLLWLGGY